MGIGSESQESYVVSSKTITSYYFVTFALSFNIKFCIMKRMKNKQHKQQFGFYTTTHFPILPLTHKFQRHLNLTLETPNTRLYPISIKVKYTTLRPKNGQVRFAENHSVVRSVPSPPPPPRPLLKTSNKITLEFPIYMNSPIPNQSTY